MSTPDKGLLSNGDARSKLASKATALNPNAAEFVPSSLRSAAGSRNVADVSRPDLHGPHGKKVLDRQESSKSNNSDDEAHQFWRKQLPDDIIPDFTAMEKDEHVPAQLSLAGLSLNGGVAYSHFLGPAVSKLSRIGQEFSSQGSKDHEVGCASLNYEDAPHAAFLSFASNNWEQNLVNGLHFANGNEEQHYNFDNSGSFVDSSSNEYADPLEYLLSQFPGFSAGSLTDLYYANDCDFNLTIEILTQLEMQGDGNSHQNLNLNPSAPSFSIVDFPALPTLEDQDGFSKGGAGDIHTVFNGHSSRVVPSGSADFVSAVRRLPSQDAGYMKFDKKSTGYTNGASSVAFSEQYSSSTKSTFGNKLQSSGSTRGAPVWLETGDAVANIYSESRGEARDLARVRNACFEQARQAYLIGNKALAKELSMKGQLYNMQMKAAHEKAKDVIYRQRNSFASGHGQDRLIDLHGLHVSEAIHMLKLELATLKSAARSSGERMQVMICVGTGHHTKASRTARLPVAVEQLLLEEGLNFTQPQPGLLRVVLY